MRKTLVISAAALAAALVVAAASAQRPGVPPGKRDQSKSGRGFPPPSPLMDVLDADRDGELSAEEIANAPQVLKKLDKNGDGKLDRDELRPQPPRGGGPGDPGGMGPFPPGGPGGPGGMGPRGTGEQSSMEAAPTPKDDGEGEVLKALQQIPQEQGWRANVPATDGRLLRLLTEAVGAKNVVEIGTSNGISTIWFALALRKTGGKLITHEIDPNTAALARKNFAAAGVGDLIALVEGNAHETVSKLKGPIDVVFIDADKEGYLDYFEKVLPLVRPGGLILAHNMNPRMAEAAFLKAITTSPDVETLFYLEGGGMSMTLKKR